VYLPRVEETAETKELPDTGDLKIWGGETILLVEDQAEVRELISTTLKEHGYQVLDSSDVDEAQATCQRHEGPIHLLLTDVIMPKMSGRELAESLAPLRPRMKALYISGYTDRAMLNDDALEPGTAFLQKPFLPSALVGKVQQLLAEPEQVLSILVADDVDEVRRLICTTLKRAGCEVAEARNGKEAVELLAQRHFDVLLTDLVMPEQEGLETIMFLRRQRPDLKIIAMSGAAAACLAAVKHLGAHAILEKPVSAEGLLEAVRQVLRQ